jgi:NPCBM/NEW2 domain/Right handed beta helix region
MYDSVCRRSIRVFIVGLMLSTVLRPTPASAQSVDIYPWNNIQQVVNGYPAGTTFYLKSGVHRLQTITPRSGDRFIGEAGTVLSGARQLSDFSRSGAYWVAAGQTQEGPRPYAECQPGFPRCGFPEDFFIDGVPLRHVDSLGAVTSGTFFFDYGADRIYFADDPTNRTVEASVTAKAFDGYATDVLISSLVIEKYATPIGEAAVPLGTRSTLDASEVRLNHYAGAGTGEASVLQRSSIHHNGGFGIIGAGNRAVVESNEIAYNNFAGMNPYWGAGGSKWVYTDGLTVRGNFSHHNGGPGLWTDIGNIRTLYENNVVEDNVRGGIFHELSYEATIRYNTARRNGTSKPVPFWTTGAGIEILDSPNVHVHDNLVEDNWQGITGLDDHRGGGPYGVYSLTNFNVHNNMIVSRISEAGGGRTGIIDMDLSSAFVSGNNRFQDNQYVFANPNGQYFIWFGERTMAEWQSYGNDTAASLSGGALVNFASGGRTRYLSDESWTWMENGWGPAERNRSNGESSANDGRQMTIGGATYAKGLGVHSYSDLRWNLGGQCSVFSAVVGIDDETASRGSVVFEVYADGALRYSSGTVTGATPAQSVWVDVSGAGELALIVTNGGDSNAYDHADWADAKVMCSN